MTVVAFDVSRRHILEEQERLLSGILDSISDGVVTVNTKGQIESINRAGLELFGFSGDQIVDRNIETLIPELGIVRMASLKKTEAVGRRKDGSNFDVRLMMTSFKQGGEQKYFATIVDTSSGQGSKTDIRESEERYALAALGANDGLWDWNLDDGTIYLSPRWRSMLGLEENDLKNSPEEWLSRIHPDDVVAFCEGFDAHLDGTSSQFEHEFRMRHANGEYRWMQARGLAVRQADGKVYRMAGSQSDITDRKLAEERLMHGALHDPLTSLPNRALMLDRLGQALSRMERNDDLNFALAILDIDRFMLVNESLGHVVGDELLVSLSRRMEAEIGTGNTLARLGGDEFAILMENPDTLVDIKGYVKRLQEVIAKPFELLGKDVYVSASFGIVPGDSSYTRASDMLRDADLAMYRAKKEGKTGFEVFEESRHRREFDQLQVETSLRQGLEEGWIHVYYQPIVDLKTRKIKGFEALSRLIHPTHGVIPPAEFIGVAEETGLIVPLGEQMLLMACAQTVEWQQQFGISDALDISVNLSARHLAEDNIVELLGDVLEKTKIPPASLKVEITESLIMSNPELAAQTLDRIKKLGITLSLDDFGTGYSSLSYLRRFPIDTLKMDRSFVAPIDTDKRDLELVRMIILLAHTLGMDVVGEGIETESHLDLLRDLDCEYGQGYFFSRPLPAADVAALLRQQTDL
ncbi:MAG: EAL domain-containing protein [Alphaproteobacteria bacterium]